MKRSAMKPGTKPLRRTPMDRGGTPLQRGATPIAPRSRKRIAAYAGDAGRAAFVGRTLAVRPGCELRWPGCTVGAVDVHESIIRSRGGAIVPGPLADAQRQRFYTTCRSCHDWTHSHRPAAEALGFLDPRSATEVARDARQNALAADSGDAAG